MSRVTHTYLMLALAGCSATSIASCSSGSDVGNSPSGSSPTTSSTGNTNSSNDTNAALGQALPFRSPAWASSDTFAGAVDGQTLIRAQVHLAMRNASEAKAELQAISDPDSPRYGQFLSDADFESKYAPTVADVAAVRARLEAQGLTITEIPSNRAYVAVQGTATQMEKAFSTKLGHYRVNGELRQATMTAPSVGADILPLVSGVLGLTTYRVSPHNVKLNGARRADATNNAAAALTCSEWWGSSTDTIDAPYGSGYPNPAPVAQCGFKPANLREAYGFSKIVRNGNDGTGVAIAIVDAWQSPTLLQDAQTYAAQNDPDYPLASSQFSAQMAPGTAQTPDTGWYDEQSLDVEAAHAMAPGANIVYVGAQSSDDQDLVAALNLIITKKLATIVSNSYGSTELGAPQNYVVWENIAQQAGLKGVGLYFSSGDDGDEAANLGFVSADFPASLPTVTAVGGTSLALGRNGEIVFETGWESGRSAFEVPPVDGGAADGGAADGGVVDAGGVAVWDPAPPGAFRFGAGGGRSAIFQQPTYQTNVVPPALSNASVAAARVLPDVAMVGDPVTGFLIGETVDGTYGEYPIGGTSLSCPLFAGVMAVAQQHAGRRFGFANPKLYKANGKGAYRDILPLTTKTVAAARVGVMYTFDFQGLAIKTAKGYDDVTGMGVPNGDGFLSAVK